jgi:hypothetical protein
MGQFPGDKTAPMACNANGTTEAVEADSTRAA